MRQVRGEDDALCAWRKGLANFTTKPDQALKANRRDERKKWEAARAEASASISGGTRANATHAAQRRRRRRDVYFADAAATVTCEISGSMTCKLT